MGSKRETISLKFLKNSTKTLLSGLVVVNLFAFVSPINSSTTISSNTVVPPHSLATPPQLPSNTVTLGSVPNSKTINLTFTLNPQPGLKNFIQQVSTPGSPLYRHYLTPTEFGKKFGASPQTIQNVKSSLNKIGFHILSVAPDNLSLKISTSAASIKSGLKINLQQEKLPSGRIAFANTASPQIPKSISPAVESIIGLNTVITPKTPKVISQGYKGSISNPSTVTSSISAHPQLTSSGASACASASQTATSYGAYTPSQLATAYNFNPMYSAGNYGQNQTIGLYELAGFAPSDISTFNTCFGLSNPLSTTLTDLSAPMAPGTGTVEVTSDIETAASLAPKSSIIVYEAPNSGTGPYDNYQTIINQDKAKIISTSWGLCEAQLGLAQAQAENTLFQQAAAQGQTVLAAAGDSGSQGCGSSAPSTLAVNDPASQPYVTGVGGTSLSQITPSKVETVWNDASTNLGAGGGGISSFWKMPSWQQGPGVNNSYTTGSTCGSTSSNCREVPDVSASADPYHGYVVYCTTGDCASYPGWFSVGGTSMATPLWASLTALVNNSCSTDLGFMNPTLYKAAASSSSPFTDITQGNNDYTGQNNGTYPATPGYDMASGLGSPMGGTLAHDICNFSSGTTSTPSGNTPGTGPAINKPIVGMASTPNGGGYWLVASDGGIFSFGDAKFYGSMGGQYTYGSVVSISSTSNKDGYWISSSGGPIFSFGNAYNYGSMG